MHPIARPGFNNPVASCSFLILHSMRFFYLQRFILSWLLPILVVCLTTNHAFGQHKPASSVSPASSLTGNGSVSLMANAPSPYCVNTPASFTARGSGCGNFFWSIDGIDGLDVSGSTFTYTFSTPGQYIIHVSADCPASSTASVTVTVMAPNPQPITYSAGSNGTVRTLTSTSAVICAGSFLDLTPPAGSSLWTWSGDPLPKTSTGSVTMNSQGTVRVTPTASSTTYTVSYKPASSPCVVSSSFTVNVASVSALFKVQNTERFGPGPLTLTISEPGQNIDYAWYEADNSTTSLQTGLSFTTPTLTQSRTYWLGTTACGPETRGLIPVTIKNVRITIGGTAPTAPVPLLYNADGATPPALVLQAETSPVSAGPFTWELNGVPLNETSAQFRATQAGRYVVRLPGAGANNDSNPVEVIEPLDGQTANGQPLTVHRVHRARLLLDSSDT